MEPPRTWLLLGDKRGDNAQVEAIAQALGWRCERKRSQMQERWRVAKPRVKASLHHIDLERSDPLVPPWPDLVITIGRRPSMAALWIAEQAGGRTRLVLVGKPSGRMTRFDLVIASAETPMPPLANLLPITLPLMRADPAAIAAAAEAWAPRLGRSAAAAGRIPDRRADRAVRLRRRPSCGGCWRSPPRSRPAGGTPYLTTSRRTPPATVAALAAGLPAARPAVPLAPEARRQPLSRSARPGRRLRRDWRQHLDAGGGRPPAPAARDLRAADQRLRQSSTSCAARSPPRVRAGGNGARRPAGDAGWRSLSIIWAWSATPATSRPSTACCSSAA